MGISRKATMLKVTRITEIVQIVFIRRFCFNSI
ncbi:MAG: hypothetical protein UX33_C0008G0003 [Candidatus Azambacteria bacterium GW2011_GWC1_46_13]|uniref:Uncharacterized protein n=1 Tax=Candidatus Azambacteria bacterium GW2011_GWC1_46_13 TaxID=1618619 RepID=A0A0G1NQQ6_9BACT|nr:MAG: hypothetical protein UX33_C0008G0003 [Candidatus Azambacteria bacterium GW2011_GWC1_46_13]